MGSGAELTLAAPIGPQLRLSARAIWRRELERAGDILVQPGDRVDPETVVAESRQPVAPVLVEIGRAELLVQPGNSVRGGEPLAQRKKLIGKGDFIQAPVAGMVLSQQGEELLLQPPPLTARLEAQLPGSVAAVQPGCGVDIGGAFGLLRGCAGGGAGAYGKLGEDIAVEPEPVSVDRVRSLAAQGIRAVVAASWTAGTVLPDTLPLTWLMTETAPGTPMAPPLADALRAHLGTPAAVQVGLHAWLGFTLHGARTDEAPAFGQGSWVRTASGRAGKLASVDREPRIFASGLRGLAADVDLGDHTETVPFDTLEWIA
ncbi:MAG TPA: hypothetical protein VFS62_14410 [Chloroflexota bacterium]|nr:hypothetical protein [Chloroflexota bacterium]